HHLDQRGRVVPLGRGDVGPFGGVVDLGLDPVEPVELLLHPVRARRARHALDVEFDDRGVRPDAGGHPRPLLTHGGWTAPALPPIDTPTGYVGQGGGRGRITDVDTPDDPARGGTAPGGPSYAPPAPSPRGHGGEVAAGSHRA